MEPKPVYTTSTTGNGLISIVSETDWESRLLETVRQLRDRRKDAIILYDHRTNTVRVYDGRALASVKLD